MCDIQRFFMPGEEWVYLKVYASIRTGENILKEIIYPNLSDFIDLELIDNWFFTKYHDPEFHLRIRIHLSDIRYYGRVVQELTVNLKDFLDAEFIHNVQLDTYEREIERYGQYSIEIFESLFFLDSIRVMKFIVDEKENVDNRWLFGAFCINHILNLYGLGLNSKKSLMDELRNAFAKEFGMNKKLKGQIEVKYALNKGLLIKCLDFDDGNQYPMVEDLSVSFFNGTGDYKRLIKGILERVTPDELPDKIKSHIHMFLNRLFTSKHRLQEFVLYYFLFKTYNFYLGKKKAGISIK